MTRGIQRGSHCGAIRQTPGPGARRAPLHLKHSVMVIAGANDVTVALQRLEDQLQRRLAHVEAVALPDRREDVQDVAALLRVCTHGRADTTATHKHTGGCVIQQFCSILLIPSLTSR